MKRVRKIFLILIVFLFVFAIKVNAADEVCKIKMNADKSTLSPGDIVTITITASDITLEKGIATFLAEFKYNENIFELVVEQNEQLKQAISQIEGMSDFEKCEVLYNGAANTSINPWYMLYFESAGQKAVFGSVVQAAQKDNQEIGKIKLKVKDGVTATTEKIEFTTIIVVDGSALETTQADTTEHTVTGTNVSLTIKPKTTSEGNQQIPQINNSNNNNNNSNNNKEQTIQNSTSGNNTQTNNQAPTQAPNTGVEDYLPFAFIIIAIGTFSYIKYKKYKDIY